MGWTHARFFILANCLLTACNHGGNGGKAEVEAVNGGEPSSHPGSEPRVADANGLSHQGRATSGAGSSDKYVPTIDRQYLLGRWSLRGDCVAGVEFKPGGKVELPYMEGKWSLVGDQLTVTGDGVPPGQVATVKVIDADSMEIIGRNGKKDAHRRCKRRPGQGKRP